MTGSAAIAQTTEADQNILSGQILDYLMIVNPDAAMTLTINEGDPMYIPAAAGWTNADIPTLSRINKVIISENATNYFWHGHQVGTDAKV